MAGIRETQEFFASRAATWDERFPEDTEKFRAAISELAPPAGGLVFDLGCGTGRALPLLREAVGDDGVVVGLDATPEMLQVASSHRSVAGLVLADATKLPVRPGSIDAAFAAGLLTHLPDPHAFLRALAHASKPAARLALFHPIGRAALAARYNRTVQPDDLLDARVLPGVLVANGWELETLDDAEDRYLARAVRT